VLSQLQVGDKDWHLVASQAVVWTLVSARVLGLCLTAPTLAEREIDWRIRLGLAGVLSTVLAPVVENWVVPPTGWRGAWVGLSEVLTGSLLGWSAALIVAAARLAGDLVGASAGLSFAMLVNAETGEETSLFGQFYNQVALVLLLLMDGPLLLVRALIESYDAFPVGQLLESRQTAWLAFGEVVSALELALRAAVVPALALVFSGIVVAWLSRSSRTLPFVALAVPLRVVLGIGLVFFCLGTLTITISRAWEMLFLR
jgi:flagellar biosynthesis protein FliR